MKKIPIIFLSLIILFICSANAQVITIGTGTAISAISPQNHATAYSVTEMLYLHSEINSSGNITHIAFEKHDGTNLDSIENVQIFLTHTNATSYVTTTFDTTGSDYVEVYSGSFPNNAITGWMEVELDTPFFYDGISNLQVLFLKTNSTTNAVTGERARYRYSVPGGARVRRYNNDTPYQMGATQLTTTTFTPNIRLVFAPVPPDCPVMSQPVNNSMNVCRRTTFSWTTPTGSQPTDFQFYLGTDGGGVNLPTDVISGDTIGFIYIYEYNGLLLPNTTYYWSVSALNTAGTSGSCNIFSFTTNNDPQPAITTSGDTLISSSATGNQWYNVLSGIIPGATNQNYLPMQGGNYYVAVTNSGCTLFSDTVSVIVGIEEADEVKISVYPNPATNGIIITSPAKKINEVMIFDITGKVHLKKEFNSNVFTLSLPDSPGVYTLQLKSNDKIFYKKIIKN